MHVKGGDGSARLLLIMLPVKLKETYLIVINCGAPKDENLLLETNEDVSCLSFCNNRRMRTLFVQQTFINLVPYLHLDITSSRDAPANFTTQ